MYAYYENPYLKELEVKVISRRDNWLKFDDTIFYPGGGGQPHDIGFFTGEGFRGKIIEVKKNEDGIWHRIENLNGVPGDNGKLEIDWERRYYLMKSHTAEHIFYRSLEKIMPVKFVKVEFSIPESVLFVEGDVTLNRIEEAERIANSIIKNNLEVKTEIVPISEAKDLRIRRERIKEENVRIVRIDDFDSSACAGIHVKSTGEIGKIVIKRIKKSNYSEIFFVVSQAADEELEFEKNNYRRISHLLNEFKDLPGKVAQIKNELENMKREYFELTERMFKFEMDKREDIPVYFTHEELGDIKALEKMARSLIEREKCIVIMGRKSMERIWVFNSSGYELHLEDFMEKNALKGGGKVNFMIHVPGEKFDQIFHNLKKYITKN